MADFNSTTTGNLKTEGFKEVAEASSQDIWRAQAVLRAIAASIPPDDCAISPTEVNDICLLIELAIRQTEEAQERLSEFF